MGAPLGSSVLDFSDIRLVEAGQELYAEFEAPIERALLCVGGVLPGWLRGRATRPGSACESSNCQAPLAATHVKPLFYEPA